MRAGLRRLRFVPSVRAPEYAASARGDAQSALCPAFWPLTLWHVVSTEGRVPAFEYAPRDPSASAVYAVVRDHVEHFLDDATRSRDGHGLPGFVEHEFRAFLRCGYWARGFARFRCGDCATEGLVAFSCNRRGFCPSCGGRRMAERAAYLVDHVLPDARSAPADRDARGLRHHAAQPAPSRPPDRGAAADARPRPTRRRRLGRLTRSLTVCPDPRPCVRVEVCALAAMLIGL